MEKLSKFVNDGLVVYGKILSPHGVKGFVKVEVLSDFPKQYTVGKKVRLLNATTGKMLDHQIECVKGHPAKYMIRFEGVTDRNEAAVLSGMYFVKDQSEVKRPENPLKYYKFDLIGAEITDGAENYGTVKGMVSDSEGCDYLNVEISSGKEVLIPFRKEFISEVDLENKRLMVKNLEGFFDVED